MSAGHGLANKLLVKCLQCDNGEERTEGRKVREGETERLEAERTREGRKEERTVRGPFEGYLGNKMFR